MNNYKCLKKQIFAIGEYALVPLRGEDIYDIMKWRNEQMTVLRQKKPLTRDEQQRYYNNVVKQTFYTSHPEQILFSYLFNGNCIGYGGLVHIGWRDQRGEVSFLLDTERGHERNKYKKDFSNFLALIKEVAFQDIGLHRLFTETYDLRDFHVSILEQNDFALEGRLLDNVVVDGKYLDSLIHGCLSGESYV